MFNGIFKKNNLKNFFKISYSKEELLTFKFLLQIYLFKGLSKKQLIRLLPHIHLRKFEKGEVIYYFNDPGRALYLINKGKISLKTEEQEEIQNPLIIHEYDCFGDEVLFAKSLRNFSAKAVSDEVLLYVISQANLFQLMKDISLKKIIFDNFNSRQSIS